MTDVKNCPKCNAPLPANAPAGICPKCLMEAAFESTVGYEGSAARAPQPGEVFGSYRIEHRLGAGGMGVVFAATHLESGRRVALKLLNHRFESPEHRQRFLREGRLAASVNHPNSVYVFGTEEIQGVPVIAMEFAGGGTLQDRVQHEGPLAIGEAVDMVLQMIDGLQAAASAGVLHRDVKPANCFLDADGAVKIGDFGLSISTISRPETNLTQSGVFLGTPAFASPEQLRGDEMDVRSDIYSVGVTLFYLLTGRTPFQAKQMVHLLATVLERPAPSPADVRGEIPAGLAKVVKCCLEKQPARRFAGYDELRQALLPYGTAAPKPATLGLRLLAYIIDSLVIIAAAAVVPLMWTRELAAWHVDFQAIIAAEPSDEPRLMILGILGAVLLLAYFALCEGRTGMTCGKAVCRLRVVGDDREPPGVCRALLRTSLFLSASLLPWWIGFAVDAMAGTDAYEAMEPWLLVPNIAAILLLFSTARRRNGFAGIHEWLSGTRVVGVPMHQRRPALESSDEPIPEIQNAETIGPYHVLGPLTPDQSESFVLGYDRRLLRKVWIRKCDSGAPAVPRRVREVSRSGRLRWLDGQRSVDSGGWDAYEAPTGKPLLQVIARPRPWATVRFWLHDLAEELVASGADGSLPEVLDLDRVWITAEGRAKLLDFPAPQLYRASGTLATERRDVGTIDEVAVFVKRVAIAALEGPVLPAEEARSHDVAVPLPVSAGKVLNRLGRTAGDPLPLAELQQFTQQAAIVSPAKRVALLAVCLLLPAAFAALLTTFYAIEAKVLREHPELGKLADYMEVYQSLDDNDPRRTAVEILVAEQFREMIEDPDIWSKPSVEQLLGHAGGRRLAEEMVRSHPSPTDQQVNDAMAAIALEFYETNAVTTEFYSAPLPAVFFGLLAAFVILFALIPSMVCGLLAGNSPLMRSLDIAVVTSDSRPAPRWRVLWRNAVFWLLVIVAAGVLFAAVTYGRPRIAAALLIGWIVTTLVAERGLHDRLAGTWLVPR